MRNNCADPVRSWLPGHRFAWLLAYLAVAGLSACATLRGEKDPSAPSADQQRMLDDSSKYIAAWNAHDVSSVASTFLPDGYLSSPATEGQARGEAIARYAAGTFAGFPDFKVEIVNRWPIGRHAIADEWVIRGTWTRFFPGGPLAGVTPSGKAFVVHGASILEWQDGQLKRDDAYFDQLSLLTQIGALNLPGGK
jgi:steroid delta-isomerase-like uncharacterized protein